MMHVHIDRLTVEYETGGYQLRPLDELCAEFKGGELVVVLGASGSGKTSLLSVLAAILRPRSGSVRVDGMDVGGLPRDEAVRYRRHKVGIVFQAFNLVPSLTARDNVGAALRIAGWHRRPAAARAEELLAQVGLGERAGHRAGQLSGGEQQRVAIARAIANEPQLLLADEPTAHLDYLNVEDIVRLLRSLAAGDRAVVVATHDERLVPLADRVIDLTPRLIDLSRPRRRRLGAGEELFKQGDASDFVYLVHSGSIEVVRERIRAADQHLASVAAGRYVGELGPLLRLPRSATARAGRDGAEVSALSLDEFRVRIGDGKWPVRRRQPVASRS